MSETTRIEAAVASVRTRLRGAVNTTRTRLSRRSGVGESSIRQILSPDWNPPTLRNLVALEQALDALDAESAGDGPVAASVGADAQPTGEACDVGRGEGACLAHAPSVAGTATGRDSITAPKIDDQSGQERGAR
ncbi:helix-turn-helix transcriptional regulator [Oceanicaulis alexandrii]|uniref:hypothetical protein n=1 Tax=Oceanicaulis alexandrii TaxID=153233 RepID=UPI0035CE894C